MAVSILQRAAAGARGFEQSLHHTCRWILGKDRLQLHKAAAGTACGSKCIEQPEGRWVFKQLAAVADAARSPKLGAFAGTPVHYAPLCSDTKPLWPVWIAATAGPRLTQKAARPT